MHKRTAVSALKKKKQKLGFEYVRKETDIIVDVSKAFLRTVEVR